jgi:hypothetical protein
MAVERINDPAGFETPRPALQTCSKSECPNSTTIVEGNLLPNRRRVMDIGTPRTGRAVFLGLDLH